MASRPYKTSHYLKDPKDRAAYLNEVLESGDFNAFLSALKNITETTYSAGNNNDKSVKTESPNILRLNTFLHDLGLRLSVDVLNPQNP